MFRLASCELLDQGHLVDPNWAMAISYLRPT